MSTTGVKAGGCSVIAKVAVVTVSVVTIGVIVAIAVPLALRNNDAVSQTATTNLTTATTRTVGVTGTTNTHNVTKTGSTQGGTTETTDIRVTGETTPEGGNPETTTGDNSPINTDNTVAYNESTTQEDSSRTTNEITQNLTSTTTPLTSTTTPQPTTTPYFECTSGYNRTVILMNADVDADDYLFFRGGLQGTVVNAHTNFSGRCPSVAGSSNPCVLSIQHRTFVSSGGFKAYNAWAAGDNFLDWYGFESTQGEYTQAVKSVAEGSPAVLTSNNVTDQNYLSYNTFGDDYWAMDVCMDCAGTIQGWFEVLGYSNKTLLESQTFTIAQSKTCTGTAQEATIARPFSSVYHVGYCGRVNVFRFGDGNCTINQLPLYSNSPDLDNTANQSPATASTSTTPATATTCPPGMSRTVVLIQHNSTDQEVFMLGGVPANYTTAEPSRIEIRHRVVGTGDYFDAYNAWAAGDDFLDYDGGEANQGRYNNVSAAGSPTVRTSKNITSLAYYVYNTLGDDVYSLEVCMNCSQTYNGWFEVYLAWDGGHEPQLSQDILCSGNANDNDRARNITGSYHIAFCGKLNEFYSNNTTCSISNF